MIARQNEKDLEACNVTRMGNTDKDTYFLKIKYSKKDVGKYVQRFNKKGKKWRRKEKKKIFGRPVLEIHFVLD